MKVLAKGIDPTIEDGEKKSDVTLEMHLTFKCPGEAKIKQIMPSTYQEALIYLKGYRRMKFS